MDEEHGGNGDAGAGGDHPREEPGPGQAELTLDQLAESKRYGRRELACTLLDMVIDLAYLGMMAFYGAQIIDRSLCQFTVLANVAILRLVCLFLVVMALHYVCSFPLSLYSGFILEHRPESAELLAVVAAVRAAKPAGRRVRARHGRGTVPDHLVGTILVVARRGTGGVCRDDSAGTARAGTDHAAVLRN
jgi:hypothetical protein